MKRRAILLFTTTMAALVVVGGIAMAVNKVCSSGTTEANPCLGTAKSKKGPGNDVLMGTSGTDYIKALSGNDYITGAGGNDTTDGGDGNDTYYYKDGFGSDTLKDSSGIDTVNFSGVSIDPSTRSSLDIFMIPDWRSVSSSYNRASKTVEFSGSDSVNFGSSVLEKVTGGNGPKFIEVGKESNTLKPGFGGATIRDLGGFRVTLLFPRYPRAPTPTSASPLVTAPST
jgi:Ca2+-binding RTX toxin-like protein